MFLIPGSCAALNGVPPEIVKHAENLVLLAIRGEDLVAACSTMPASEAQELEEAVWMGDSTVFRALTDEDDAGSDCAKVSRWRCCPGSQTVAGRHPYNFHDY